jgi:hypothetical protein
MTRLQHETEKMENVPSVPRFPPKAYSDFVTLVTGIGTKIGNTSVHETGHQLQLPYMDCDGSGPYSVPCPERYIFERSSSGDWSYKSIPGEELHWTDASKCAIAKHLLGDSYKSFDNKCK